MYDYKNCGSNVYNWVFVSGAAVMVIYCLECGWVFFAVGDNVGKVCVLDVGLLLV